MHRVLILAAAMMAAPIEAHSAANALASPATLASPASIRPWAGVAATEQVEIKTSDALELTADWYPPSRKKGLAPGALLVHDAGRSRAQLTTVATRLQKSGFGVLTIDLRGHGSSSSKSCDWKTMDEDARRSLWALATRDVEAASRWLLARDNVHSTNLSLIGVGSGCALAVRHAKRDENVRCVALLSPRAQDFGFDVAGDLVKIEGLPTLILMPRNEYQKDTERMVLEANSDADPYVELIVAAPKVIEILDDRKTAGQVSNFVREYAMPKKGRE